MKKKYIKPEVLCDEEIALQELITGVTGLHSDGGGDGQNLNTCHCGNTGYADCAYNSSGS